VVGGRLGRSGRWSGGQGGGSGRSGLAKFEALGKDEGAGLEGAAGDEEGEGAVELFSDLDALAGVGALGRTRKQLVAEEVASLRSPADGVVLADDAVEFETAGGVRAEGGGKRTEGGAGELWWDGEAQVEGSLNPDPPTADGKKLLKR
jgi:hypothetical protein